MHKLLIKYCQAPIPDNYLVKTDEYEVQETGNIRKREFFAWRPVYIGRAVLIPLNGGKFTWLKRVIVTEKEVKHRVTGFDSGWTYQTYWKSWKFYWDIIDIETL